MTHEQYPLKYIVVVQCVLQAFIIEVNKEWNGLDEEQRTAFLKAPPPQVTERSRVGIKRWFTSVKEKTISSPIVSVPSPSNSPIQYPRPSTQTANSSHAFSERESFLHDKKLELIKKMLSNIGADPHKFLTEDLLNDQVFMTVITQFSYKYETFHRLREKYEARKTKGRKSGLSNNLAIIKDVEDRLAEVTEVSSFKIDLKFPPMVWLQTCLKKAEHVSRILVQIGRVKDQISNVQLNQSLRRRVNQQTDIEGKQFSISPGELTAVFCENGMDLKWDDVFHFLIDLENSGTNFSVISSEELLSVANLISTSVAIGSAELAFVINKHKIRKIVRMMPLVYILNKHRTLFINLHEIVFTPGVLESLLCMEYWDTSDVSSPEEIVDTHVMYLWGMMREIIQLVIVVIITL